MASFALRGRRSFLLVACAAGAATVAAVGATRTSLPAGARAEQTPERTGYRLSEHARKYYRSTLV